MGKIRDKSQELVNSAIPHVLSAQQGAINLVHLKRNVEMMTASLDLQIARKAYVNTHILVSESVFAKSDYLQKKGTAILQDVNRLWKLRLQLDELRSTVNSSLNYMDALMYLVYNEQPMLFPELDSHVNNYTDLYKQTGNIRDLKSQHEFYYRLMLERLSEDFDRDGFLKAQLKLRQSKMQRVSPNSKKIVGNVVDSDQSLVSANSSSLAGVRAQTEFIDSNTKPISARQKVMNQYQSSSSAGDSQLANNAAGLRDGADNAVLTTDKNTADFVTHSRTTALHTDDGVFNEEHSNRNQLNADDSLVGIDIEGADNMLADKNMSADASQDNNISGAKRSDALIKDPMLLSVLDKEEFDGVLSEDYQQKVISDLHSNPYMQDNAGRKKNVDTINASLESHRDTLDGHNIFIGNNEFTASQGKDLIEDGVLNDDTILEIEHVQERHTGPIFFKSREHDLKLLSLYKSELDRFDTLWSLFTKLQTVFSYDTNNLSNEIDALSHSFTSGETAILHGELSDISQLAAQIKPMVMMTVGFSLVGFWIVIFLLNRFIIRPLKNIARILIVFRRTKRVNIKQNEAFFAQDHVMEIREIIDILPQLFDEFSSIEKKSSDLDQRYKQLLASSKYDALTKVLNRGTLNLLVKSMGADTPANFAVLMVDIDYFKNLNDTMGHQRGDEVLFAVAQTLQNNLAKKDFVFRYGGEEFCVVLSEISPSNAYKVAERLCSTIRKLALINNGVPCGIVTVSIGISLVTQSNSQFRVDELISQADKALYLAKRNGRNQAVACPKAMVFAMNDDDGSAEIHNNQEAAEANPNSDANTLAEDVTHGRSSAPLKALASLTNEARTAQSESAPNNLSASQDNSNSESSSITEIASTREADSSSTTQASSLTAESSISNIEKNDLLAGRQTAEEKAAALNSVGLNTSATTTDALDNGANAQNYESTSNVANNALNSQAVIHGQTSAETQAQAQAVSQNAVYQDSQSANDSSNHAKDASTDTKPAHKGMLSMLRSAIEHDVAHPKFRAHKTDQEMLNYERQIEAEFEAEQSLENATTEEKIAYRVAHSPSMISLEPFDRYDRRHRHHEHNQDVKQHKTALGSEGIEQSHEQQIQTSQSIQQEQQALVSQQLQPNQQTQQNQLPQEHANREANDSHALEQTFANAQAVEAIAAPQSKTGHVASHERLVLDVAHINEATVHTNVTVSRETTIASAQANTAVVNSANATAEGTNNNDVTSISSEASVDVAGSVASASSVVTDSVLGAVNSVNTANSVGASGQNNNAVLATQDQGENARLGLSSAVDLHSQSSKQPEQENQEYELVITTDEAGNSHEYFIGEDEGPIDLTKLNAEQSKNPSEKQKDQFKLNAQSKEETSQAESALVKQTSTVSLMMSNHDETPKKVASKSLGAEAEDIVLPQSNELSQVVIDRNLVAVMAAANPERGLTEDPLTSDRSIIDMRSGPIVLPCLFDCETFFPGYAIDEDQFDSPQAVFTQQESEYLIDVRLNNNDYASSPFLLKEDPSERERSHEEVEHWSLATLFNLFKSYTHKREEAKHKDAEHEAEELVTSEHNQAERTASESKSDGQLNAAKSQQLGDTQAQQLNNAQLQYSNGTQPQQPVSLDPANQLEEQKLVTQQKQGNQQGQQASTYQQEQVVANQQKQQPATQHVKQTVAKTTPYLKGDKQDSNVAVQADNSAVPNHSSAEGNLSLAQESKDVSVEFVAKTKLADNDDAVKQAVKAAVAAPNLSEASKAAQSMSEASKSVSNLSETSHHTGQLAEVDLDSTKDQDISQSFSQRHMQSLHQVVDQALEQEVEKSMREAQASALHDDSGAEFKHHTVFSEDDELLDKSDADNNNVVLQTMKNIVSTPNDELFSKIEGASKASNMSHADKEGK